MTTYQELVAVATNRTVTRLDANGTTNLTVVGLDTAKVGARRNGDKVPYVVMKDDEQVVILLHPREAEQLFSKGATADFVFDMPNDSSTVDPVSVVEVPKQKRDKQAKVVVDKEPSKRDKLEAVFIRIKNAGGRRSDFVKEAVADHNMTPIGAQTYWYNFNNGPWKVNVEVEHKAA